MESDRAEIRFDLCIYAAARQLHFGVLADANLAGRLRGFYQGRYWGRRVVRKLYQPSGVTIRRKAKLGETVL
jgi:hypothetical protein